MNKTVRYYFHHNGRIIKSSVIDEEGRERDLQSYYDFIRNHPSKISSEKELKEMLDGLMNIIFK